MEFLCWLRIILPPGLERLIMSKPPKKLIGRPTTDDRGNSTWRWETAVDTARVRALAEGLSFEPLPQEGDLNPYNQSTSQGKEKTKARSLDDMRRLNEQMKRERALAQADVPKKK